MAARHPAQAAPDHREIFGVRHSIASRAGSLPERVSLNHLLSGHHQAILPLGTDIKPSVNSQNCPPVSAETAYIDLVSSTTARPRCLPTAHRSNSLSCQVVLMLIG